MDRHIAVLETQSDIEDGAACEIVICWEPLTIFLQKDPSWVFDWVANMLQRHPKNEWIKVFFLVDRGQTLTDIPRLTKGNGSSPDG